MYGTLPVNFFRLWRAITSHRKSPPTSWWVWFHKFLWSVCHTQCQVYHDHHVTCACVCNGSQVFRDWWVWSLPGWVCRVGVYQVTLPPSLSGSGHCLPDSSAPQSRSPFWMGVSSSSPNGEILSNLGGRNSIQKGFTHLKLSVVSQLPVGRMLRPLPHPQLPVNDCNDIHWKNLKKSKCLDA